MTRIKKYVYVGKFKSEEDIHQKIYEALDWIKLKSNINNSFIFIKPNLTWPYYISGLTSSPRMLEALTCSCESALRLPA